MLFNISQGRRANAEAGPPVAKPKFVVPRLRFLRSLSRGQGRKMVEQSDIMQGWLNIMYIYWRAGRTGRAPAVLLLKTKRGGLRYASR